MSPYNSIPSTLKSAESLKIEMITENDLDGTKHYRPIEENIDIPITIPNGVSSLEWATNMAAEIAQEKGLDPKSVVIINRPLQKPKKGIITQFSVYQFCPKNSACYS